MFDRMGEGVFRNRGILELAHVPPRESIVGRDDEIDKMAESVQPAVNGNAAHNTLVYGKTGSGKTLVTKHVLENAVDVADHRGIDMGVVYVDCSEENTETKASRDICLQLVDATDSNATIPNGGVAASRYYREMWSLVESFDTVVIILDEIDRLGRRGTIDDELLMKLSRAHESGKTDTPIGVIGISNKTTFREKLSQRVKSSLGGRDWVFPPYDVEQLTAILRGREGAFNDGVLTEGAVRRCAAIAAQDHGDARKALRILYIAGEIAQRRGDDEVTDDHVGDAQMEAESDRVTELLRQCPHHSSLVTRSLALLEKTGGGYIDEDVFMGDDRSFRTKHVYTAYRRLCDERGFDSKSEHRVRELLNELVFLEIITSEKVYGGRSGGNATVYRLVRSVDAVMDATE